MCFFLLCLKNLKNLKDLKSLKSFSIIFQLISINDVKSKAIQGGRFQEES